MFRKDHYETIHRRTCNQPARIHVNRPRTGRKLTDKLGESTEDKDIAADWKLLQGTWELIHGNEGKGRPTIRTLKTIEGNKETLRRYAVDTGKKVHEVMAEPPSLKNWVACQPDDLGDSRRWLPGSCLEYQARPRDSRGRA